MHMSTLQTLNKLIVVSMHLHWSNIAGKQRVVRYNHNCNIKQIKYLHCVVMESHLERSPRCYGDRKVMR